MFGLKKFPPKVVMLKHDSVNPGFPAASVSNPFDSDDEFETKGKAGVSRRSSSEPTSKPPKSSSNPFSDQGGRRIPISSNSSSLFSSARSSYKNDFRELGGLENQSVQELENYAVRAHNVAADMDRDLSRGEKLLGNLGGLFERKWKPKKTRRITGPTITRDVAQSKGSASMMEQKQKLGLTSPASKQQPKHRISAHDPADAMQKVEVEKAKQDDTLSEISNILGEMKEMVINMGTEIDWQNKALEGFDRDVEVIGVRVKEANRRGLKLLRK